MNFEHFKGQDKNYETNQNDAKLRTVCCTCSWLELSAFVLWPLLLLVCPFALSLISVMCGRSGTLGPMLTIPCTLCLSCVFRCGMLRQGLNSWMDGLTSGPADNRDTGRRQGCMYNRKICLWHVVMSRCSCRSLDEVGSCRSLVDVTFS